MNSDCKKLALFKTGYPSRWAPGVDFVKGGDEDEP